MKRSIQDMNARLRALKITVRDACLDDLAGMTGLLGELFSIEADFTPDIRRQRLGLASLMANPEATLLVAVNGNGIVGMCTLQPLISTAEGGTVGIVEDLVVADAWRSKGIGSMLIHAIEKTAQNRNMSRLQLLTDQSNEAAKRFYKKQKWEQTQLIAMRKKFD